MEQSDANIDLLEGLKALRKVSLDFARAAEHPFEGLDIELSRLRATVENLGTRRPARPLICPEDYRQQWNAYCSRKRAQLESRAWRYLCWDADVATDTRFQTYLDGQGGSITARSLQGLVRSCHLRWSQDFARMGVAARVRSRLREYKGVNRVISHWKSHPELVLGSQAHKTFGEFLLSDRRKIETACESWKFDENTQYVREAARYAVSVCEKRLSERSPFNIYLARELLAWANWPEGDFRDLVASSILKTFPGTAFAEELKKLVIGDMRLGDPRLPKNHANWVGLREAERRFTEWLSKDDIVFFFEHVLPKGRDPHQRKMFWLRYVARIVRSRPLLSWEDGAKLRALKEKVGNFGHTNGDTSAFILDFGRVVAVEFSKTGNACYLYQKTSFDRLVPDFWAVKAFSAPGLKRPEESIDRIAHQNGWQDKMSQTLARFGVRPTD
jgi:EH_Signature domain